MLSVVAIRASDGLRVPGSGLLATITSVSPCPKDMVLVDAAEGAFCIDRYEASPNRECPVADPRSAMDTQRNIDIPKCLPQSVAGASPWTNVPQHQAELLCARAGKRLPSNAEWYRAAMGSPDTAAAGCALNRPNDSHPRVTGNSRCVSSAGVEDMVGNVWEWVAETTLDGTFYHRTLPPEGFVAEVAADGVASQTSAEPQITFNGDAFFIDSNGVRGMIRGGFWGMAEKAGIYAVNASIPPSFTGEAIGFRCVRRAGI